MDLQPSTSQTKQAARLVVVRQGRFATFALLGAAFAGEPNVRLIWDRRVQARRRTTSVPAIERRHKDRRSSASWGDHNYVVVTAGGSLPADHQQERPAPPAEVPPLSVWAAHQDIRADIEAAFRSDVNVLITGGDPLSRRSLAQQIHQRSVRRHGPFVVVDRGLAIDPSWGRVAAGATFLIEEVVDLNWKQQTELLTFLDHSVLGPGGTHRAASRGPRVITATSHWLLDRLASTELRADLFYRLNLIHVMLPSGTVQNA